MSEYRDDRQALLQQIADLEAALERAERRAQHHVEDALRVGEVENDNRILLEKLRYLEQPRVPLRNLGLPIAAAAIVIFTLMIAVIVLLVRP